MKYLLIILFVFICYVSEGQTTQSPEQIRQEMARIRQTTNWDDPAAAAKANEQIKVLAKKLMGANPVPAMQGQQQQSGTNSSKDARKLNELNQEMIDQKMDVWAQIWKSAAGGEGADILLAEPLRKEIVQEFKDDETPSEDMTMLHEEITFLCIDMSSPTARLVIDQMENYKSIKTLIITGGDNGSPVDLNDLLRRASNYPLENLYIINFRQFVRAVPGSVGMFSKLQELALFNNNLMVLPDEIGNLDSLKCFFVDINPLNTLSPAIDKLTSLDTLSIAKTQISDMELEKISRLLPKCVILKK